MNPGDSANPNTAKSLCFFAKIELVKDDAGFLNKLKTAALLAARRAFLTDR
jgi:hypothetical protein